MTQLTPHFEKVQHHYDLSDDFYRLFLDPTQTYSCAYFERDDMTLEEAQIAKIDLALGKLNPQPGMTLLDIGCGWGATMRRAIEKYDVNVIGLTLSENQAAHVRRTFDAMDSSRTKRVLLEGWERFDEPVDRIVSIGAFEHFGSDRYTAFFKKAYNLLSDDGVMLLHTIVRATLEERRRRGAPSSARDRVCTRHAAICRAEAPARGECRIRGALFVGQVESGIQGSARYVRGPNDALLRLADQPRTRSDARRGRGRDDGLPEFPREGRIGDPGG